MVIKSLWIELSACVERETRNGIDNKFYINSIEKYLEYQVRLHRKGKSIKLLRPKTPNLNVSL